MITTDQQVRKLMSEYQKTGKIGLSAIKSGMNRKTATKYLKTGKLPSESPIERHWRTRSDPFERHWVEMEGILSNAPELEAKFLFEHLMEKHPNHYHEGQVRTFQRKVRDWRALKGPDKEVFFPQVHEPGRIMATDFTRMDELGITICGQPFPHMLCHSVLTYSNWEWGVICHSESMYALKRGVQDTLSQLGHVPSWHWTDNSTAATHTLKNAGKGNRKFNKKYIDLMSHYGMRPHTIQVGAANENGDVESLNGVLKKRINQYLLLRGHRDFNSQEEYKEYIEWIMRKANNNRWKRFKEELAVMPALYVSRLPDCYEETSKVNSHTTVRFAHRTYSVPCRLIGEWVRGMVYEERIDVYFKGTYQLTLPRLTGAENRYINYRHIIDSLIKKPGAFRRYRYHGDLFPTGVFRWAYDSLLSSCSERIADMEYLRILQKAAHTMECQVQDALQQLKDMETLPRWNTVLEFLPSESIEIPDMKPLEVNLNSYDALYAGSLEVSHG